MVDRDNVDRTIHSNLLPVTFAQHNLPATHEDRQRLRLYPIHAHQHPCILALHDQRETRVQHNDVPHHAADPLRGRALRSRVPRRVGSRREPHSGRASNRLQRTTHPRDPQVIRNAARNEQVVTTPPRSGNEHPYYDDTHSNCRHVFCSGRPVGNP